MMTYLRLLLTIACVSAYGVTIKTQVAYAQTPVAEKPVAATPAAEAAASVAAAPEERTKGSFNESLMFSDTEILKINTGLAGIKAKAIAEAKEIKKKVVIPANRRIHLSGIAYSAPDSWMIWINGQRNTPTRLLPEIVDIEVHETYIDLKWFDKYLKKIIKLRLRPNQVYDITTGVLLPG